MYNFHQLELPLWSDIQRFPNKEVPSHKALPCKKLNFWNSNTTPITARLNFPTHKVLVFKKFLTFDVQFFRTVIKKFPINILKRLYNPHSFPDNWCVQYSVLHCRPLHNLHATYQPLIPVAQFFLHPTNWSTSQKSCSKVWTSTRSRLQCAVS